MRISKPDQQTSYWYGSNSVSTYGSKSSAELSGVLLISNEIDVRHLTLESKKNIDKKPWKSLTMMCNGQNDWHLG